MTAQDFGAGNRISDIEVYDKSDVRLPIRGSYFCHGSVLVVQLANDHGRSCQVCGAMGAIDFCPACGVAQE